MVRSWWLFPEGKAVKSLGAWPWGDPETERALMRWAHFLCHVSSSLSCAATDPRDQAKKPLAESSANRSLTNCFFFFKLFISDILSHDGKWTNNYGNSIFNFLRNCHIVLHSDYGIWQSHQGFTRFGVEPWRESPGDTEGYCGSLINNHIPFTFLFVNGLLAWFQILSAANGAKDEAIPSMWRACITRVKISLPHAGVLCWLLGLI